MNDKKASGARASGTKAGGTNVGAQHYRWTEIPREAMKGGINRQLITSERMMIAHVRLKKGDEVPTHSHENEQITYILEGALHFWRGPKGDHGWPQRAQEGMVLP